MILGNWCEAGGTPEQFWRETPRSTMAMIRAYHRRRGWLAWHIAALSRMQQLPELHELTGQAPPEPDPEAEAERRLENLRAWKAALKAKRKPKE